ncbi:MAG: hypothetical protein HC831_31270 [Chloroflexia bacterium]|nr:hypothetical protein [Chloroflexia bacterium]
MKTKFLFVILMMFAVAAKSQVSDSLNNVYKNSADELLSKDSKLTIWWLRSN